MNDPAFTNAGQELGLELWRIEDKKPVKQAEATGRFYSGDSYILLSTMERRNKLYHNIHFWLGAKSSQDEMGIAAYKTVELDESLGGSPVQYRELQGNESALFLSYFKRGGVEYLEGGVESGFNHVERDSYTTRLYHLKGRRTVRAKEVSLTTSSLNKGDVFILDMGLEIFLYNGENANMYEKVKGVKMCQRIKDEERGGRARIIIVGEDEQESASFWSELGGKVKVTFEGESDAGAERAAAAEVTLARISEEDEEVKVEPVARNAEAQYTRDQLEESQLFLLNAGDEVFLWIGKEAPADDKRKGMVWAQRHLSSSSSEEGGLSPRLSRVVQGAETPVFKGHFYQWTPPSASMGTDFSARPSGVLGSVAAPLEQKEVDVEGLARRRRTSSATSLMEEAERVAPTEGGKLQIWRIENFERAEWPEERYGHFYAGDCFLVLYTYTRPGSSREEYLLYYWQGRHCTMDERGASALQATNLDDELGGRAVQVRVMQGKEPGHFRALFEGRMVVHSGGTGSGFANQQDTELGEDSCDRDGVSLLHVKGNNHIDTAAVQVSEVTASLNSSDCFLLLTSAPFPRVVYVWNGCGSNEVERETALGLAGRLKNYSHPPDSGASTPEGEAEAEEEGKVVVVDEGQEPEEFWERLGGKGEYVTEVVGELDEPMREPRLFQMSDATGVFNVEEIPNFSQDDLCNDDVMLLDVFSDVYVWVGNESTEREKRMAMETATKYVAAAEGGGRHEDTPIILVRPGSEPAMFTQHFLGWDVELASGPHFEDPYATRLERLREEQEAASPNQTRWETSRKQTSRLRSIEMLEKKRSNPSADVNAASPFKNFFKKKDEERRTRREALEKEAKEKGQSLSEVLEKEAKEKKEAKAKAKKALEKEAKEALEKEAKEKEAKEKEKEAKEKEAKEKEAKEKEAKEKEAKEKEALEKEALEKEGETSDLSTDEPADEEATKTPVTSPTKGDRNRSTSYEEQLSPSSSKAAPDAEEETTESSEKQNPRRRIIDLLESRVGKLEVASDGPETAVAATPEDQIVECVEKSLSSPELSEEMQELLRRFLCLMRSQEELGSTAATDSELESPASMTTQLYQETHELLFVLLRSQEGLAQGTNTSGSVITLPAPLTLPAALLILVLGVLSLVILAFVGGHYVGTQACLDRPLQDVVMSLAGRYF